MSVAAITGLNKPDLFSVNLRLYSPDEMLQIVVETENGQYCQNK